VRVRGRAPACAMEKCKGLICELAVVGKSTGVCLRLGGESAGQITVQLGMPPLRHRVSVAG
jgi:hypothetical protein